MKTVYGQVLLVVLFVVLSCVFWKVLLRIPSGGTAPAEWDIDVEEIAAERRAAASNVFVNGTEYRLTHPVKTYLIMGTDGDGNVTGIGDEYLGDCADALVLLMVDDERQAYGEIQIDRDTMMDINVLDSQGRFAFTYYMQLCLAHVYGGNPSVGCQNERDAVSELLGELDIDRYYALPIGAVQKINHELGGVTVTIEDDFSAADPSLVQGETITLSDEQAETFVRGRMSVGEGDNVSRMRRQKRYVEAMRKRFETLREEDTSFVSRFLGILQEDATTDISMEELKSLADKLAGYTDLGEYEPDGWFEENDTFGDGVYHKEFYTDEASLEEILCRLYPLEADE